VDLIGEQHVAGAERREDGRQIALPLEHRPAGDGDLHPHLTGQNERERCLAEARRACQQHVIEWLPALTRSLQENAELVAHGLLPHE